MTANAAPARPLLPCRQPGCPGLIRGGGFCPDHARPAFDGGHRASAHPLPRRWSVIRARILRRDRHRCVLCGNVAVTVDHITARAFGGSDDDSNLRSLCSRHGREKDIADTRHGRTHA